MYYSAKFTFDDGEHVFDGYALDKRTPDEVAAGSSKKHKFWNGWAQPMFTMEQAERLAYVLGFDDDVYYDEDKDAWCVYSDQLDDYEVYPGTECKLATGEKVVMYPIGAGAWIWDMETDEEWQAWTRN